MVGVGKFVVDPPVNLQAATPGTQQTGNINVSGAIRGGTFFGESAGTATKVVSGWATSPTGFVFGGDFRSSSTDGRGVFASVTSPTGATYGGDFRSASSSGRGIFGFASATSGATFGGDFRSDSPLGKGVVGRVTASTGATYGVYGEVVSPAGRGLVGKSLASTGYGYGVWGLTSSDSGNGVVGQATAAFGNTYGVVGESYSPNGIGVNGFNNQQGGLSVGVWGTGVSALAIGVQGSASSPTGTTYGIYGTAVSQAGYGGYFNRMYAVSVAGGVKAFKIDHPLDPENKYLQHSSVESPDMMNVYNGNTVTGSDGRSWVTLPSYFEALNRDFRYQLTTIGQFAQVMVETEIQGNRFLIRSDKPNVKVSWQVTGIRHDALANQDRIQVEKNKEPQDRGRYLAPEAFGQPAERGIMYQPERRHSTEVGESAPRR